MLERTSVFLCFLKNVRKHDLALTHCPNPQLVQEFVQFMMDKARGKTDYLHLIYFGLDQCQQGTARSSWQLG